MKISTFVTRSFLHAIGRTKSAWLGAPEWRWRAPRPLRGVSDRWWTSEEEYCFPGTRLFPSVKKHGYLISRNSLIDGLLVMASRRIRIPQLHNSHTEGCHYHDLIALTGCVSFWRSADMKWLFLTAQILQQLSVDGAILPIKVIARARAKEPPNNAMPELLRKMTSSVCMSIILWKDLH